MRINYNGRAANENVFTFYKLKCILLYTNLSEIVSVFSRYLARYLFTTYKSAYFVNNKFTMIGTM